jgi:hypothetical protein
VLIILSNPTAHSDFTVMDGTAFQTCLEDILQGYPLVIDMDAIGKFIEELSSAIRVLTAKSAVKLCPVPTAGFLHPLV